MSSMPESREPSWMTSNFFTYALLPANYDPQQLQKKLPQLVDYEISIPPGGRTDAFVETIITWELNDKQFKTRGFESDQQAAAITATLKMLNLIER